MLLKDAPDFDLVQQLSPQGHETSVIEITYLF